MLGRDAVFQPSSGADPDAVKVEGPSELSDINHILSKYHQIGFQATQFGKAAEIIREMRQSFVDHDGQQHARSTIYLGYTSNLMSSGLRDVICYLVKNKMVDAIVTTCGGVEEDLIKCLAPTYVLNGQTTGESLRKRGLNRIGNLVVPNDNYCKFEDWLNPILDQMVAEQRDGQLWTPSSMIRRLGQEINHEESVYYWCYKNNIPVYCPAITDGSIGDMIFFHSYRSETQLIIDLVQDIRAINKSAMDAKKTGMIILGGGVVKHHICNANLMRNGADYAVYINTGQEFDGSDAGASPDEAVSWGKIRADAKSVKICADATLVFPLLVSMGFANTN